jgi:hypothetical protein
MTLEAEASTICNGISLQISSHYQKMSLLILKLFMNQSFKGAINLLILINTKIRQCITVLKELNSMPLVVTVSPFFCMYFLIHTDGPAEQCCIHNSSKTFAQDHSLCT